MDNNINTGNIEVSATRRLETANSLELAMPTVMVDEYVPEVCETLESRQKHLALLAPHSRIMKPDAGMQSWVELRVATDSGNRRWFYAVDLTTKDIVYLMHLNPLKMKFDNYSGTPSVPKSMKRMAMYQGSVWRADGSVPLIGNNLPSNLFWRLFKGNQNWFSDSLQSRGGKIFWERRIQEALERGHDVYAVHFSETNSIQVDQLVKIEQGVLINHYWTYETKKDDSGMYWRFAIVHPD